MDSTTAAAGGKSASLLKMTSEMKLSKLPVTFHPEELYNLCDKYEISFRGEEAFDRIRQWLNHNKDDSTRMKTAATYQGGGYKRTPLHRILAKHNPPLDIIQKFIKYAPESVKVTNNNGSLPLHIACCFNACLEVVQALLNCNHETVKVTNNNGSLPLHCACENKASFEVVQALVNSYPESVKVKDNNGSLPLHIACRNNACLEVVQALVNSYPESVKVTNNNGNLPLHFACGFNASLEVVQALVNSYPETVKVKDNNGVLPLHLAVSPEVAQALLQASRKETMASSRTPSFCRNENNPFDRTSEEGVFFLEDDKTIKSNIREEFEHLRKESRQRLDDLEQQLFETKLCASGEDPEELEIITAKTQKIKEALKYFIEEYNQSIAHLEDQLFQTISSASSEATADIKESFELFKNESAPRIARVEEELVAFERIIKEFVQKTFFLREKLFPTKSVAFSGVAEELECDPVKKQEIEDELYNLCKNAFEADEQDRELSFQKIEEFLENNSEEQKRTAASYKDGDGWTALFWLVAANPHFDLVETLVNVSPAIGSTGGPTVGPREIAAAVGASDGSRALLDRVGRGPLCCLWWNLFEKWQSVRVHNKKISFVHVKDTLYSSNLTRIQLETITGIEKEILTGIVVQVSDIVNYPLAGIILFYRSGKIISYGGTSGRKVEHYMFLGSEDYITRVDVKYAENNVYCLTFTTNTGRILGPCGGAGKLDDNRPLTDVSVPAPKDQMLVGLFGTSGSIGLGPPGNFLNITGFLFRAKDEQDSNKTIISTAKDKKNTITTSEDFKANQQLKETEKQSKERSVVEQQVKELRERFDDVGDQFSLNKRGADEKNTAELEIMTANALKIREEFKRLIKNYTQFMGLHELQDYQASMLLEKIIILEREFIDFQDGLQYSVEGVSVLAMQRLDDLEEKLSQTKLSAFGEDPEELEIITAETQKIREGFTHFIEEYNQRIKYLEDKKKSTADLRDRVEFARRMAHFEEILEKFECFLKQFKQEISRLREKLFPTKSGAFSGVDEDLECDSVKNQEIEDELYNLCKNAHEAVEQDRELSFEKIEEFLEKKSEELKRKASSYKDEDGWTALFWLVAARPSFELLKKLVKVTPPINIRPIIGPFEIATAFEVYEIEAVDSDSRPSKETTTMTNSGRSNSIDLLREWNNNSTPVDRFNLEFEVYGNEAVDSNSRNYRTTTTENSGGLNFTGLLREFNGKPSLADPSCTGQVVKVIKDEKVEDNCIVIINGAEMVFIVYLTPYWEERYNVTGNLTFRGITTTFLPLASDNTETSTFIERSDRKRFGRRGRNSTGLKITVSEEPVPNDPPLTPRFWIKEDFVPWGTERTYSGTPRYM